MKMISACFVIAAALFPFPARSESPDGGFNKYVLTAVKMLGESRAAKGYGSAAFTQDLTFGDDGILKASGPPITMCVAAQLEVLVEALNLYARETKDVSPFHYIPKVTWARLRPLDLRGQIWMVNGSPSTGAAHAFENFGMGKRIAFKNLFPGTFVNFNRTRTGHGVVFLGYIDKTGADLSDYSNLVAGFKYFSAQGMGKPDGGLGYRWGFFADAGCPSLPADKKRDCGIIRSEANNLLVGGYVAMPNMWDAEKAAAQVLSNNVATDPALTTEGTLNESYFSGITTDD
ncbi:hypothetical protein FXV83_00775 [Bradyrhizobium hipponense]|uniref:Uncharacterized protein n=1 Tax=Bradyrhizobium hipponense TaxID=2605638 RepID=A0A5S4YXS0_9BRAD|nr:hypothetical protein [Bradyrhizobium hipponense]TYO68398.1 hypothetical protein FXV83_00775 [Bradyrhizobium hipponense]